MRLLCAAFALLAGLVLAAPAASAGDDGTLDAVHHTADGYYLDFLPVGKVELPRLFLVRRDGRLTFEAFGSSTAAVASGRYAIVAEHEGERGVVAPGVQTETPPPAEAGTGAAPEALQDLVNRELIGETTLAQAPYDAQLAAVGGDIVVDFSPTRHLLFALLAMTILFLLFVPVAGRYKQGIGRTSAPRGVLQNMLETVIIYIRDEIAKPNMGDKYRRYLPYLLTAFFFILTCNLLGLVPWGATATANLSVTAVLALFTFFITQFAGTKDYWAHIFWPPGVPTFVKFILIPVEFLGLFTKPFALAVRLFANLTAGHLIILNLIGLIFIIGGMFGAGAGYGTAVPAMLMTLFVYGLEVLVAFIQAYVFTMLSALFIGMASAEHEHDHDHTEDHGLTPHDVALSHASPMVPNGKLRKERERTVGTEAAMA